MYQTVIILLVTAVVTVITTIITVRVTMTGRVISQDASGRLKAKAKKCGKILVFLSAPLLSFAALIYYVLQTSPITRVQVLLISFYTTLTAYNFANLMDLLFDTIRSRRRNRLLPQLEALEERLKKLQGDINRF